MYVHEEELNDLMVSLFTAKELEKVKWDGITASDKVVLLHRATAFVDSLDYLGRFLEEGQQHAFPRIIDGEIVDVTDDVKFAVVCYVYYLLDSASDTRTLLQKRGVKSWSSGDESESYDLGSKFAPESFNLVKGYLHGYLYNNEL